MQHFLTKAEERCLKKKEDVFVHFFITNSHLCTNQLPFLDCMGEIAKIRHKEKLENRFLLMCTKLRALMRCYHYKWYTQKYVVLATVNTYMILVILMSSENKFIHVCLPILCTTCRESFCFFMFSHILVGNILYP